MDASFLLPDLVPFLFLQVTFLFGLFRLHNNSFCLSFTLMCRLILHHKIVITMCFINRNFSLLYLKMSSKIISRRYNRADEIYKKYF